MLQLKKKIVIGTQTASAFLSKQQREINLIFLSSYTQPISCYICVLACYKIKTIHYLGRAFSVLCIEMLNCQTPLKLFLFRRQWQRTVELHRRTQRGQDGCALDRRRGVWKLAKWSTGLVRSGSWGVWGVHFRDSARGGDRRGERRCASRNFICIFGEYSKRMFGSPNKAVFSRLLLSVLSVSW